MTYNRPESHWSGPPHPDVVTRGAGHAQALKHYADMAEMAADVQIVRLMRDAQRAYVLADERAALNIADDSEADRLELAAMEAGVALRVALLASGIAPHALREALS